MNGSRKLKVQKPKKRDNNVNKKENVFEYKGENQNLKCDYIQGMKII